MFRAFLHENLFHPKMLTKLILFIWSYHIAILKLLHCISIAVFFLYFYLSKHEIYKPLWQWIIINFQILWKINIVFCVWKTTCWKPWKTSNCRNFAKQEFWKVEHVKLFLVKHNSILGWDITRENTFVILQTFYI